MDTQTFYSHGKLLITGEYLVLDGAKALAMPCRFGQHLKVTPSSNQSSRWISYTHQKEVWLDIEFDLLSITKQKTESKSDLETRLFQILYEAFQLNPEIFTQNYRFETHLEFPRDWGLGTSSTLIANIAKWANVNPYELLAKTFGGSGYDVACAESGSALIYQLQNQLPKVDLTEIPEVIKPHVYFVYLGQKQNSRSAILNYRKNKPLQLADYISKTNEITSEMLAVESLEHFQSLIESHESLLSEILQLEPVQKRLFPDFEGNIKSLGAWGGDFVMAVSKSNPKSYFESKGYFTVLEYSDMAL
jgi:mevalonate kinase